MGLPTRQRLVFVPLAGATVGLGYLKVTYAVVKGLIYLLIIGVVVLIADLIFTELRLSLPPGARRNATMPMISKYSSPLRDGAHDADREGVTHKAGTEVEVSGTYGSDRGAAVRVC